MGNILDGKALSAVVKDEVRSEVAELEKNMAANHAYVL